MEIKLNIVKSSLFQNLFQAMQIVFCFKWKIDIESAGMAGSVPFFNS